MSSVKTEAFEVIDLSPESFNMRLFDFARYKFFNQLSLHIPFCYQFNDFYSFSNLFESLINFKLDFMMLLFSANVSD